MSFFALFKESQQLQGVQPGAQQLWLRDELRKALGAAGLTKRATKPDRIVFGISERSRYDIEALDDLLRVLPETGFELEVFLISDELGSMANLEARVPGIVSPKETPLVVIWRGGVVENLGTGDAARQLLSKL